MGEALLAVVAVLEVEARLLAEPGRALGSEALEGLLLGRKRRRVLAEAPVDEGRGVVPTLEQRQERLFPL